MARPHSTARLAALAIIGVSAAILATVLLFQYAAGLAPCELCIYQRYPYGAAIALAVLLLLSPRRRTAGALLLLCAVAFLATAGIGLFHVGVEQHWWGGLAACSGPPGEGASKSLDELRAQIMATPVVRCDKIAWSLFGISLAGYNVLVGLALAALTCVAAARTFKGR